MKIEFPSREFDDAVAAVCHGVVSDEQARALNELLRQAPEARDEYILQIELHSRLASTPDLFVSAVPEATEFFGDRKDGRLAAVDESSSSLPARGAVSTPKWVWSVAVAASLISLAVAGWWKWRLAPSALAPAATSKAVAMLNQTLDAQWNATRETPQLGAPLNPGWLKLEGGLAQIVFYSGARVVIEGPAEIQLISANHVACRLGKIIAEVPPEARGFSLDTPQLMVTDAASSFGAEVWARGTELHVFKGSLRMQTSGREAEQSLREGAGTVIEGAQTPRLITANRAAYASLLNVRERSQAVEALRFERWRASSDVLNRDASLLVHFDFEHSGASPWQLPNVAQGAISSGPATIVGCQFTKGRWPEKRALEFQNVSDRVRVSVPGEFESVTFAAWVRVQGLDRKLNSLFMSDGFSAGTLHWLIRNDGVLGVTIVGPRPGDYQVVVSPAVVTLEKLGMWIHLAVVIDGRTGRAVHYVNGRAVAQLALRIAPPYRVGPAELGNWNGKGFPETDPDMIRNFSGAMDDFCLFGRALDAREIQMLYADGKLDSTTVALREARAGLSPPQIFPHDPHPTKTPNSGIPPPLVGAALLRARQPVEG